jgi:hypothetical protein
MLLMEREITETDKVSSAVFNTIGSENTADFDTGQRNFPAFHQLHSAAPIRPLFGD